MTDQERLARLERRPASRKFIPNDLTLRCEDHPNRPATHSLSGVALLCDECADDLRDHPSGYPVLRLPIEAP